MALRTALSLTPIATASVACLTGAFASDMIEDFERSPKSWSVVDEPAGLMGDATPGQWAIVRSPILDGSALHQSSNTWGDKTDVYPLGTYYVYDGAEYRDFILEVDVYPNDNDGFGFLFRYRDRKNHYRFLTMVDPGNPENAPAKDKGPWSRFDARLGDKGDDPPYYELLGRESDTYQERKRQKVRLEVNGNVFVAFIEGKKVVAATDPKNAYSSGKIGFVCFAQNDMDFDNLKVTDLSGQAISPRARLTTLWADLKSAR